MLDSDAEITDPRLRAWLVPARRKKNSPISCLSCAERCETFVMTCATAAAAAASEAAKQRTGDDPRVDTIGIKCCTVRTDKKAEHSYTGTSRPFSADPLRRMQVLTESCAELWRDALHFSLAWHVAQRIASAAPLPVLVHDSFPFLQWVTYHMSWRLNLSTATGL